MRYRSILVVFRQQEQAETLAGIASKLSELHGAHVTGLYMVPQFEVYPAVGFPVSVDMSSAQRKLQASESEKIKSIFDTYAKRHDGSWEWRYVESAGAPVSRLVQSHAHTADLVVLSPPSPGASYLEPDMVFECLLMGSGRPLLIVPNGYVAETLGQNTLIAWNGTKEAARAAFDGLPAMMPNASGRATVVWLDPPAGEDGTEGIAGSELANALARHGLKVSALSAKSSGSSIGAELLQRCCRGNVDLLVMGGFGHSRIREFVLGGATDHVLGNARIPVLMAH